MIDNLPSQVQLHKLLKKQKRSREQEEQIILAIKKGGYDMPDVSFLAAYGLVKNKQNSSDQKYINLEELILNAIKIKIPQQSVKKYLQAFSKYIGQTKYLQKLYALIGFSYGKQITKDGLETIVKEDLTDLDIRKRLLTSYKRQGKLDEYIKKMNAFLEENPSDTEAWIELAQIYTEKGLFLRALFCFEEVIVIHPENEHYIIRLAELYTTLGGKDNVKSAIKYYSHVISRYPKNLRALWGLYRLLQGLGDKIEPQQLELKNLCDQSIHKQYSKLNPSVKIHIAF